MRPTMYVAHIVAAVVLTSLFPFNGSAFAQGFGEKSAVKVTATLSPEKPKPGQTVTFSIKLQMPKGYHTYPQKTKAGLPTKISVREIAGLEEVDKAFTPTTKPKMVFDPATGETYEAFEGTVTWVRKYRVKKSVKSASVDGAIRYQICTDTVCKPPKTVKVKATATVTDSETAEADFESGLMFVALEDEKTSAGKTEPAIKPATKESYPFINEVTPARGTAENPKPDPIRLKFALSPKEAKPGETVKLSITATLEEGWHAFALTHPKGGIGLPVEIKLNKLQALEPTGKGWRPDVTPKAVPDIDDPNKKLLEHGGTVVWSREFRVVADTKPGAIGVAGSFRYQICKEVCLSPKSVSFQLGNLSKAADAPPSANTIDRTPFIGGVDDVEEGGLAWFLVAAFLGGLILNVMPCVLPVIAIKVMSFVQQAGEDRRRIFTLNAAYSAGVICVFLALATFAVGIGTGGENLGWGGLFQKPEFNLAMACLIFAMGLALLGVFEIPLPGFVGSAAGGHQKEGLGGAFVTGIFATLLATPCTGPFLGTTLAWSVQQSIAVNYLIWFVMGFGMAFPYLIFGLFPQAIKLLPKPGNWMVLFKQFAGFALMGTVVFFVSFLAQDYVVPALVMMMGIALGLWMIGNLYNPTTHIKHKVTVRVIATILTVGICGFGYSLTIKSETELPWKPFSEQELKTSLAQNKTVLVDFTASWCTNCKVNEKFALNTHQTLEFVRKHDVVPLVADYSNQSPEIKEWLTRFKTDGVPLTVIFPANRPDKPIPLRSIYSQSTLLEKLEEAVSMPKIATDVPQSQAAID